MNRFVYRRNALIDGTGQNPFLDQLLKEVSDLGPLVPAAPARRLVGCEPRLFGEGFAEWK